MRKHIAPFRGHARVGDVYLFAAQGTRRDATYRLSHDLTERNKTTIPAVIAAPISATEY